MRILYLSTAKIPSRNANSVHIMKMCSAFASFGHRVSLVIPLFKNDRLKESKNIFEYYGVEKSFQIITVNLSRTKFGVYRYALNVYLKTRAKDFDLIFSRNLLCTIFYSFSKTPKILELHQPIPDSSLFQKHCFKSLLKSKNFSGLVVISRPLKKIYLENYNLDKSKVIVAPDGADVIVQKPKLNTISKRINIGYFGHLYKGRGVGLILELAKKCTWGDFYIYGGTKNDIVSVKKRALNISNVKVKGYIEPRKVQKQIHKMHILLAPYQNKVGLKSGDLTTEKWMSPLKIFEYMSSMRPMICSDIDVLKEVLINNYNCVLCNPEDVNEWFNALTRLKEDYSYYQKISINAQNDIIEKYSWRQRVKNILSSYVV